ncbi:hypothetical protein HDV63DRAFT_369092 [Trichoderma sp. SZMC 28014]
MKAAIYLSILAAASAAVQRSNRATNDIATNDISAQSNCGELGVMSFNASELPDYVSLDNVRMCAKHPQGRNRTLDLSEGASLPPALANNQSIANNSGAGHLNKRSCEFTAPYGCSRGWCWKTCDQGGKWCWTAEGGGYGPWRKCASYTDCGTDDATFGCGQACGKQCGCSC